MEQIFNIIYVVVGVLLLFGAAIFVHEFGHYWVARKCGLKVEAFAIGFGPKIFGWTKNGIEYSWRWIPAGGYVKLPQMVTSEALEGGGSSDVPPAPPFAKILVAVAGPFMNVVFAFVIATVIYFVGLPVAVNPSIIGYVKPDSAEAKLGIVAGDRIVEVDGKPVKTWQNVFEITALSRTNVLPVVIDRKGTRSTYHLTADSDNALGLKMFDLDSQDHPVIGKVEPGKAAEVAGLQSGDKFISFAGVNIIGHEQLRDIINKRAGVESDLVVDRGGERKSFKITPFVNKADKRGMIGIQFASTPIQYELQKPGPTPIAQVNEVWNKTIGTISALFHSKETGIGAKDLSGPVGILAVLAAQVNADFRLALSFLVLLNINLAIINLMPLPVLDGGHITMSLYEMIFRRRVSPKFQEYATSAFALLLISFMLYVTFFDIRRFSLFRDMFQRETTIEKPATPLAPVELPPEPVPAKP